MNKQITSVFYDANLLPFKDSARTIHYPLTSGTFVGSHNTKQIRFYVRDIGGTDNITWVVLSKLPNGKLGYEICSNVTYDSELGEYYLLFDLSAYYTSVKGDLYLSLRGYEGEVEFEDDNNDGVYNIVGDPLIEVTGTIKLAINYSPMVNTGTQVLPTDIDKLILALNNYIPKGMGIVVIQNTSADISSYNDGQIFFVEVQKAFYKKVSGALVKEEIALPFTSNANQSVEELYNLYGNKPFTLQWFGSLLICHITYNYINWLYQFDVYQYNLQDEGNISYYQFGTNTGTDTFYDLFDERTPSKTFTTKEYVDSQLQEFLQKEYDKVDIVTYPTLDSFLASTGEEGYIYLYPIDTSDESKGYYQYIWESNAWVSLGTTAIDLSGYVEKTTSANKVYGTNELGGQTTYTVDDFYEGNIARRDNDGSITVPLTPTQNGHASSKKYVDDEINDLSSEVDDKLEEKANVDGNYPTLTAGLADNLTPYSEDSGAEQENPFISNGTGTNNNTEIVTVGDYALFKEKQGNSVVVNQQFANFDIIPSWARASSYWGGLTPSFNSANKTLTLNGTTTSSNNNTGIGLTPLTNGHKYLYILQLISGSVDYSNKTTTFAPRGYDINIRPSISNQQAPISAGDSYLRVIDGVSTNGTYATFDEGVVFNNAVFMWQLIDLTQWFNGDILQDLLDNPSHFSWYQNKGDYIPHNQGTLENANGVKLVSTGRNLCDEVIEGGAISSGNNIASTNNFRTTNYIPVIPNYTCLFSYNRTLLGGYMYIYEYDENKQWIEGPSTSAISTIPYTRVMSPKTRYVRLTFYKSGSSWSSNLPTKEQAQIVVSLYYTPAQGGEGYDKYYPYEQPYIVDTGDEVLRKAGSVKDYKGPNGTIHRLVGVVDLGTLNWEVRQIGSTGHYRVWSTTTLNPIGASGTNLLCSKYLAKTTTETYSLQVGVSYSSSDNKIIIYDTNYDSAAADMTAFKSAMSGVYLFYELATETTEQGTPFAENLPINDYGMLYWLDENDNLVGIPQGAKIFYPVNYKGYADDLYMRTDGDASKVVIQEELVVLTQAEYDALTPDANTFYFIKEE